MFFFAKFLSAQLFSTDYWRLKIDMAKKNAPISKFVQKVINDYSKKSKKRRLNPPPFIPRLYVAFTAYNV